MSVTKKLGKSVEVAEAQRDSTAHEGFVAELFLGNIDFSDFLEVLDKPLDLSRAEQEFEEELRKFLIDEVDPIYIDENNEVPEHVLRWFSERGVYGLKLPRKYRGKAYSQRKYNRIINLIATRSGALTALNSASSSIGVQYPIKKYGTERQKEKFLPLAACHPSGFAFTEREAGSDPSSMKTHAVRVYDDNGNVKGYRIFGEKIWTTNGPRNDEEFLSPLLCLVALTVDDPSELEDPETKPCYSIFILPTEITDEVDIVQRCDFMGLNGIYNGVTRFNGTYLPKDLLLGEEETGNGFRVALEALNTGRLTLASACVAITKSMADVGIWWGNERKQWGPPIGKHEKIGSGYITPAALNAFAMEAMVDFASRWADAGMDTRIVSALCKVYTSERSYRVIDDILQARGGRGYETAASLRERGEAPIPIEEALRSARVNRIFEGSTETLGLLYTIREGTDPYKKLGDKAAKGFLGFLGAGLGLVGRYGRNLVGHGISARVRDAVPGPLHKHLEFVEENARRLARSIIAQSIRYQDKLIFKQLLFERWFWIVAELYAITATCFYAGERMRRSENSEDAERFIELADVFGNRTKLEVERLFWEIGHNEDEQTYRLSKKVLNGSYTDYLREDIVSPVEAFDLDE